MIDGVDILQCPCFSNWHVVMTYSGIVVKEVENCCIPRQKSCKEINCVFKKQYKQLKRKTKECEKLKAKIEKIFTDLSPEFDTFCDICEAKDKCNGCCCFEQIRGLLYEVK